MRYFFILTICLGMSWLSQAQECDIVLNQGANWSGKTTQGTGDKYGNNQHISITKISQNQYQVSDFSAGLLDLFGFSVNHPLVFNIDCNKQISVSSFSSDFGEVQVSGGVWDSQNNRITIHWSISHNNIVETSVFSLP